MQQKRTLPPKLIHRSFELSILPAYPFWSTRLSYAVGCQKLGEWQPKVNFWIWLRQLNPISQVQPFLSMLVVFQNCLLLPESYPNSFSFWEVCADFTKLFRSNVTCFQHYSIHQFCLFWPYFESFLTLLAHIWLFSTQTEQFLECCAWVFQGKTLEFSPF